MFNGNWKILSRYEDPKTLNLLYTPKYRMYLHFHTIVLLPDILNTRLTATDCELLWLSSISINKNLLKIWNCCHIQNYKTVGIETKFEGLHSYFKIRQEWCVLIYLDSGTNEWFIGFVVTFLLMQAWKDKIIKNNLILNVAIQLAPDIML